MIAQPQWHEAIASAFRGDIGELEELLDRPPVESDAQWSWAGQVLVHLQQTRRSPVELPPIPSAPDASSARPLELGCCELLRSAFTEQDTEAGRRWAATLSALPVADPLIRGMAEAWRLAADGDWPRLLTRTQSLGDTASSSSAGRLLVEATALRALAELELGDLERALDSGRTASRMGRTEGFLSSEHLTAYVLARLRRHTGRPIAAARIAAALADYAPWPWMGAVDCEALLSEGPRAPLRQPNRTPAAAAAEALRTILDVRTNADQAWSRLETHAAHCGVWRSDLTRLREAFDPRASGSKLGAWSTGQRPGPPPGLPPHHPRVRLPGGVVIIRADAPSRRVPTFSLRDDTAQETLTGWDTHPRIHTLLSVVGLADSLGVAEEGAFEQIYGFAYEPEVHGGRFGVLIHRARSVLPGHTTLRRDENRLWLHSDKSLLVADPRCGLEGDDRVLRHLLRNPASSAKEISAALSMPLRTVQAALRDLQDQGFCTSRKQGRTTAYMVDDTTFEPPTKARAANARSRPAQPK